jgi:hypothetical protein
VKPRKSKQKAAAEGTGVQRAPAAKSNGFTGESRLRDSFN